MAVRAKRPTGSAPSSTDCGALLLSAVTGAASRASVWDADAKRIMVDTVSARVRAGPVSPLQAVLATTLMPNCFQTSFPPLVAAGGSGPPADMLMPQPAQGITSWYWVLLQGTPSASPAPVNSDLGLLIVLKQTSMTAAESVWSLDIGAAHAGTWTSQSTVYMAPSAVTVSSSGVAFNSESASGSINVSPTTISINITMPDGGLIIKATASTARGPTYEQAGGNIKNVGSVQNGYWSIVDGALSSLLYTQGGSTMNFQLGTAWLDYQQIGLSPLGGLQTIVLAALGGVQNVQKPTGPEWLFIVVQAPDIQISAYALAGPELNAVKAGKAVAFPVANVWYTGEPAQYGISVILRVLATYDGTTVPAIVQLYLPEITMSIVLTTTLSRSNPPPLLTSAAGSGYESPATITFGENIIHNAHGVIEWVTPGLYPTTEDALAGSGLPQSILNARKPSTSAIATLVSVSALILAAFLALAVGIPVAIHKHNKK